MVLKTMPTQHSTTRFSDRVTDYINFRPHYPIEVLDVLAERCGLTPESVIADIGSGTGMLTRLFLENGNPVVGVEPNQEMREAAERLLADFGRFRSIAASAEATRLPAHTFDFVTAAQAFHWFDPEQARAEFLRILKPEGVAVLVWNDRRVDSTPFLRDYEAMLHQYALDYEQSTHKQPSARAALSSFFQTEVATATVANVQRFDLRGLLGRLQSASYVPAPTHANHAPLVARATEIFAAHQQGGVVTFEYDTRLYFSAIR
jgi:ubiquinone/menaquinone biosynthesis C-methylase UbiE